MRIDAALLARIDALTGQVSTLGIARSGVVRALIALGLAAAEKDVSVLLVGASTPAAKIPLGGRRRNEK